MVSIDRLQIALPRTLEERSVVIKELLAYELGEVDLDGSFQAQELMLKPITVDHQMSDSEIARIIASQLVQQLKGFL